VPSEIAAYAADEPLTARKVKVICRLSVAMTIVIMGAS
jgi:hypothetical protein